MLSCCLNKWQAQPCGTPAGLLQSDYLPSSTGHRRALAPNCDPIWLPSMASDHAPSLPSSAFHLLHRLSVIVTDLPQGPRLFPISFGCKSLGDFDSSACPGAVHLSPEALASWDVTLAENRSSFSRCWWPEHCLQGWGPWTSMACVWGCSSHGSAGPPMQVPYILCFLKMLTPTIQAARQGCLGVPEVNAFLV